MSVQPLSQVPPTKELVFSLQAAKTRLGSRSTANLQTLTDKGQVSTDKRQILMAKRQVSMAKHQVSMAKRQVSMAKSRVSMAKRQVLMAKLVSTANQLERSIKTLDSTRLRRLQDLVLRAALDRAPMASDPALRLSKLPETSLMDSEDQPLLHLLTNLVADSIMKSSRAQANRISLRPTLSQLEASRVAYTVLERSVQA